MTAGRTILSIAIIATGSLAFAEDVRLLERWYGRGVHAYFAGRSDLAVQQLSRAIEAGTRDPRAYYFRGLAYLNLGQDDRARADMARGGRLETLDVDGVYPVNRSLERVQGTPRLLLEQFRREATLAAYQREQARRRRRYEMLRRREREVLRQQVDLRLDRFARPVSQAAMVRDGPGETAPPVPEQVDAAPPQTRKPVDAHAAGQQRDPLAEAPGPAEKPRARPKAKMAPGAFGRVLGRVLTKALPDGEAERPGRGRRPEKGADADDPFADDPPSPGGSAENAAAAAPGQAEKADAPPADPFGEAPPAGEEKTTDTPTEASQGEQSGRVDEDPFGDDGTSDASDEDDPFGGN